jgi:hypothetical protein
MTRELIKRVDIDEYIRKLKRDYIIDPGLEISYIIMKDDSIALSLTEDEILNKDYTKQRILDRMELIIAKPIW